MEFEVENETLLICSASLPRQGWDEKFNSLAAGGDVTFLDSVLDGQSSWDEGE